MQPLLSLEQLERWSAGIAAAATAESPQEIAAHFTAGARTLLAADRVYVGLYLRDPASVTIDEQGPDRWNRDYDAYLYRQDPFFRLFTKSREDFVLSLSMLDRGEFQRSSYYRDFYAPSQSLDEITAVFNFDPCVAGYVTFLRQQGAQPFRAPEVALVEATREASRTVLKQLWNRWRSEEGYAALPDTLSPRESQIATLLLDGSCAKTIASQLAISSGTVRNHIKAIYRKLGIHSQVELITLARNSDPDY